MIDIMLPWSAEHTTSHRGTSSRPRNAKSQTTSTNCPSHSLASFNGLPTPESLNQSACVRSSPSTSCDPTSSTAKDNGQSRQGQDGQEAQSQTQSQSSAKCFLFNLGHRAHPAAMAATTGPTRRAHARRAIAHAPSRLTLWLFPSRGSGRMSQSSTTSTGGGLNTGTKNVQALSPQTTGGRCSRTSNLSATSCANLSDRPASLQLVSQSGQRPSKAIARHPQVWGLHGIGCGIGAVKPPTYFHTPSFCIVHPPLGGALRLRQRGS